MKNRLFAVLVIVLLSLSLLTACVTGNAQAPNPTSVPSETENSPSAARLTEEQVLDIALKHAGLSKDQISRLKVEFGFDDGVSKYDVEFAHNGWEYEYEIHAESGKIRAWDKDRDD